MAGKVNGNLPQVVAQEGEWLGAQNAGGGGVGS